MTININELRRKLRSDDLIDHIDIHANVKPVLAELLDRLEAAEKELAELRSSMKFRTSLIGRTEAERDALRVENAGLVDDMNLLRDNNTALLARIEAKEKQEPVAWCATDETGTVIEALGMNQSRRFDTALYLAPGAKGE